MSRNDEVTSVSPDSWKVFHGPRNTDVTKIRTCLINTNTKIRLWEENYLYLRRDARSANMINTCWSWRTAGHRSHGLSGRSFMDLVRPHNTNPLLVAIPKGRSVFALRMMNCSYHVKKWKRGKQATVASIIMVKRSH